MPWGICWSGFTNGFAGADPQVWIGVDLPEWICPRGFTGGVAAVNLTKVDLLVWICWSGFARGDFAGENPQGRICRCGFAGMNLPVMDWPVGRCGSAGFAGVDLPGWIRRGGLAGVDLPGWICHEGFTGVDFQSGIS